MSPITFATESYLITNYNTKAKKKKKIKKKT